MSHTQQISIVNRDKTTSLKSNRNSNCKYQKLISPRKLLWSKTQVKNTDNKGALVSRNGQWERRGKKWGENVGGWKCRTKRKSLWFSGEPQLSLSHVPHTGTGAVGSLRSLLSFFQSLILLPFLSCHPQRALVAVAHRENAWKDSRKRLLGKDAASLRAQELKEGVARRMEIGGEGEKGIDRW